MLSDGTYTAVVDSIDGGLATVFLERDGEVVHDHRLPIAHLPEEARHEDAILRVDILDRRVVRMEYDAVRTEQRQEDAQRRFDRLSRGLSRGGPDEEPDESTVGGWLRYTPTVALFVVFVDYLWTDIHTPGRPYQWLPWSEHVFFVLVVLLAVSAAWADEPLS